MGLSLEISLDKDIKEIDAFFDDLKFKAVTQAAKQGLNRAARDVRAAASKQTRARRKMQLKEVRKRITMKKATGMNISKLEARIRFSGVSLPMILFILGQKTPKVFKVGNKRRRPRRFEVVKGQAKEKGGLFIQKAQRGASRYQVFRRVDPRDKSKGFKMQSTSSIAELFIKQGNLLRKIENHAVALVQREYDRALSFQLSKLKL